MRMGIRKLLFLLLFTASLQLTRYPTNHALFMLNAEFSFINFPPHGRDPKILNKNYTRAKLIQDLCAVATSVQLHPIVAGYTFIPTWVYLYFKINNITWKFLRCWVVPGFTGLKKAYTATWLSVSCHRGFRVERRSQRKLYF